MNRNAEFDIFLSHTFGDKELVERAFADIRLAGRSVYVDWLTDAQLDRSRVDANTADLLRNRIKRCGSLFFAVSTRSPLSKWMPWELGYADAWSGRVFVFPLDEATVMACGQEYLQLYPIVDRKNLGAFVARHVPKVDEEMLSPGALDVTAARGERAIENLPRLAMDPGLAARRLTEYWRAYFAMFGMRVRGKPHALRGRKVQVGNRPALAPLSGRRVRPMTATVSACQTAKHILSTVTDVCRSLGWSTDTPLTELAR